MLWKDVPWITPSSHWGTSMLPSHCYITFHVSHEMSIVLVEGSLEVKLRTLWTDGKAEAVRVREEKKRSDKIREEKKWEERRCRCSLHKISALKKLSGRRLLPRSVYKISLRALSLSLCTDLLKRSLGKTSGQDIYKRSLGKIYLWDLCTSSYKNALVTSFV